MADPAYYFHLTEWEWIVLPNVGPTFGVWGLFGDIDRPAFGREDFFDRLV
jgi:hypothetical protein